MITGVCLDFVHPGIDFDEFLGMYRRLFVVCRSVVSGDIADINPQSQRRLSDSMKHGIMLKPVSDPPSRSGLVQASVTTVTVPLVVFYLSWLPVTVNDSEEQTSPEYDHDKLNVASTKRPDSKGNFIPQPFSFVVHALFNLKCPHPMRLHLPLVACCS